MAAHVEDARERLIALNRPVPEPTKEELAESEAEEQSRTGITFKDRAMLLVKRGPVTVNAARIGEPTLTDPPAITAPEVHKTRHSAFTAALQPVVARSFSLGPPAATAALSEVAAAPEGSGGTLQLENVPAAKSRPPAVAERVWVPAIVSTGEGSSGDAAPAQSGPPTVTARPVGPVVTPEGAARAAEAAGVPGAQNPGGLAPVAPTNNQPLPPVEKPAEAPAQTNDVKSGAAQVQTGTDAGATAANGKKKPRRQNAITTMSLAAKRRKRRGWISSIHSRNPSVSRSKGTCCGAYPCRSANRQCVCVSPEGSVCATAEEHSLRG